MTGKDPGRVQRNPAAADPSTPEGLQRIQAMVKYERARHGGMVRAGVAQRLIDEIYRLRAEQQGLTMLPADHLLSCTMSDPCSTCAEELGS